MVEIVVHVMMVEIVVHVMMVEGRKLGRVVQKMGGS